MSRRLINKGIQKFYRLPAVDSQQRSTTNLLKLGDEKNPDKDKLKGLDISREMLEKSGVKFKPGHAYLHVVTTGAGEIYSCNLKGDYYHEAPRTVTFPEAPGVKKDLGPGLKQKHCTFLNADGVYRHHDYNKSPEGKIVFERYNEPMHRGEVILELPLEYWEKDLENYCQGKPLRFSQGSSVRSDLCSQCSFEYSAKEPERCDHMKNHKLEIMPDGSQVFVYNPDPDFYEISEVGSRPADKISYCLRKVADDESDADEFRKEMNIPRGEIRVMFSVPSSADKKKVLNKLKDHVFRMSSVPSSSDVEAVKSCSMSPEEKGKITSRLSPLEWDELLPALRKQKCMLTPQVFRDILCNNESEKNIPDVRDVENAVGSVMGKLSPDDIEGIVDDTTYSSLTMPVTESARSSIQPIESRLSLDPVKAAMRPSQDGDVSMIIMKKASEPEPAAEFLAREYLKYQSEVLSELGSDDKSVYLAAANQKARLLNKEQ